MKPTPLLLAINPLQVLQHELPSPACCGNNSNPRLSCASVCLQACPSKPARSPTPSTRIRWRHRPVDVSDPVFVRTSFGTNNLYGISTRATSRATSSRTPATGSVDNTGFHCRQGFWIRSRSGKSNQRKLGSRISGQKIGNGVLKPPSA